MCLNTWSPAGAGRWDLAGGPLRVVAWSHFLLGYRDVSQPLSAPTAPADTAWLLPIYLPHHEELTVSLQWEPDKSTSLTLSLARSW